MSQTLKLIFDHRQGEKKEIQKNKYLVGKKSFLNQMKGIFHSF